MTASSPLATLDIRLPGLATLNVDDPEASGFLIPRQDWENVFNFICDLTAAGPLSWCAPYQPIYASAMAWRPALQIIGGYVGQTLDSHMPEQIAGYAQSLLQDAKAINGLIQQLGDTAPTAEAMKTYGAALEAIETQLRGLLATYETQESLATQTGTWFRDRTSALLESVVLSPAQAQTLAVELARGGYAALFEDLISIRDGIQAIAEFSALWEAYPNGIRASADQIKAMLGQLAQAPSLMAALPQAAVDGFMLAFEQGGQSYQPLMYFQMFWQQCETTYPAAFST
jgi:hypothetical protein